MASAFVSKSRRVRFDLTLRVIDLNNVPLVSGTSFIKWNLPSSTAAEHRGRTQKCAIKDHRVQYGYEKRFPVRLVVGKDGALQECIIEFEVMQEYSSGGRGERITLGHVNLNLAEYVDLPDLQSPTDPDSPEEGITRRYLMQDSKINSTLKIGLSMRQIEGTREYKAPQLRTAPVFGGIAGIISSSEPAAVAHGLPSMTPGDNMRDIVDAIPSLSTSRKELGEMQDMYRRTLMAHWVGQPGELKADDCIEDIFSGGDGWGKNGRPRSANAHGAPGSSGAASHADSDMTPRDTNQRSHHRTHSRHRHHRHHHRHSHHTRSPSDSHGHNFSSFDDKEGSTHEGVQELRETDVINDLCSWRVSERAYA